MRKMAVVLLMSALALQAAGPALAMDRKDPARWQEKRVERLAKELNLTAEQKGKVAAVLRETAEKKKAEMEKMRQAVLAEREATDQKIKAVLTPEQAQKFDALRATQQEKMKDRHGSCPKCAGGEK